MYLERYRATLFPIYVEVAGDGASYMEVAKQFDEFVMAPDRQNLMMIAGSNPALETNFVINLFLEFLGNGNNSGPSSFVGWANWHVHQAILPRENGAMHASWEALLNQYVSEVGDVATVLSRIADPKLMGRELELSIALRARRASILSEKLGFVAQMWRPASGTDGLEGKFLGAQSVTARDTFHNYTEQLRLNLPSRLLTVRRPQLDLVSSSRLLQTEWLNFNNPLHWMSRAFVYHLNHKRIGVEVTVVNGMPDIEIENPSIVRALLAKITMTAAKTGTNEDPRQLSFSWNDDMKALAVSSGNLLPIIYHDDWPAVSSILTELGLSGKISFDHKDGVPVTLYIPIAFQNAGPSGSVPPDDEAGRTSTFNVNSGGQAAHAVTALLPANEEPAILEQRTAAVHSPVLRAFGRRALNPQRPWVPSFSQLAFPLAPMFSAR